MTATIPSPPAGFVPVDLAAVKLTAGNGGSYDQYNFEGYNKANPYNYPDLNVQTITANGTVDTAPSLLRCDCTTGAITVTLPYSQSVLGKIIYVCKVDSGIYTVTLAVNTGDNLWKPTTLTTLSSQYQSCAFASVWDGTNYGWQCISAT